jgi:hypothetical protein
MPPLQTSECFLSNSGRVAWGGVQVVDSNAFDLYLQGPVRGCLLDEAGGFSVEMHALASTGMATATLQGLLTSEPDREDWEVGEAIAHCVLEDGRNVRWPWNPERDRRTPRASLPGADLVGFLVEEGEATLVFGEVKTSHDAATPPAVMTGRTGMIHQLDDLATRVEVHYSLLKWLHARCRDNDFTPLYRQATQKYLYSGGRDIVLMGLLMRDTQPNELDLRNRAHALALAVNEPTRVELTAWYFPRPLAEWVAVVGGAL